MNVRVGDLAQHLGAVLGGDAVAASFIGIVGATADSRSVRSGQLFVPIIAERDGHDFIAAARSAGAPAWFTLPGRPMSDETGAIVVDDTESALRGLAGLSRRSMSDLVIGVTGSAGKTSTKDLLASVLRTQGSAAASEKSFNNEIGVPLTLANAPDDAWASVIEMGARGAGHIAALCALARPKVGVITNIGTAHRELFRTRDATADAKGELVDALPANGTAVLNLDDDCFDRLARRSAAAVIAFSAAGATRAAVRATDVRLGDDLRPSFVLHVHGVSIAVDVAARGAHQVANACAAAAAAAALGVPLEAIARGLAIAPLSEWRMELVATPSGARVINDSYNANPASMRAALDALASMRADRRVALLGPMGELGDDAGSMHEDVAAHAGALGIEVIAIGTHAYGSSVELAGDFADALRVLGPVGPSDAVLVKASRAAGFERLAELLTKGSPS